MISDQERRRLAMKDVRRLEANVDRQRRRLETEHARLEKARNKLAKIGRGMQRGLSLEDGTPLEALIDVELARNDVRIPR